MNKKQGMEGSYSPDKSRGKYILDPTNDNTDQRKFVNGIDVNSKKNKFWEALNINPGKISAFDCFVKALALVEKMNWYDIYDILVEEGRNMSRMPMETYVVDSVMINKFGYDYISINNEDGKKDLVWFCKNFPTGRYIVIVEGHAVPVINGKWYDKMNINDERKLLGYFVKKHNNQLDIKFESKKYNTANKKELYESIMMNIAKEVKKALNEN